MGDGYYMNYLRNSTYYKNLSNARNNISNVKGKINGLIGALNNAGGDIPSSMINDLNKLNTTLSDYSSKITSIQTKLSNNALFFDQVLAEWKRKVGTVYKSVKSDLQPEDTALKTYNNYIIDRVDIFQGHINLILSIVAITTDVNDNVKNRETIGKTGQIIPFH